MKKIRKTITGDSNVIRDGWTWLDGEKEFQVGSAEFERLISKPSICAIRVESLSVGWVERIWHGEGITTDNAINVQMTLRKETKGDTDFWYAYRKVGGQQFKRYIGQSDRVTEKRILEIAQKLPG